MTSNSQALQQLVDRAAIHDLLTRYYHAADSGNRALLRGCFTDDIQLHHQQRPPVSGIDALMNQIPLFDNLESGRTTICTHFMGNLQFKLLEGDVAETETNTMAFLVSPKDGGQEVTMRALRYLDRMVRVKGEWKIAARIMALDWNAEMPCSFARTLAERVGGIPASMLPA